METINTFIDQLLGLPFAVGLVFVLAGLMQLLFPAKKINSFYGYRTSSSMHSTERWQFAQSYSARKMILGGVILLFTSLLQLIWKMNETTQLTLSLILIFSVVAVLILSTENAIKINFPKANQDVH